MLMKFEKAAVILKPYRVKLILAMVIVLIGGFIAANNFDQNDAITIRTISMTLAWWLWLLFLIPTWFAPENRADIEGSMFPRLSGAVRVYFMAFMMPRICLPDNRAANRASHNWVVQLALSTAAFCRSETVAKSQAEWLLHVAYQSLEKSEVL